MMKFNFHSIFMFGYTNGARTSQQRAMCFLLTNNDHSAPKLHFTSILFIYLEPDIRRIGVLEVVKAVNWSGSGLPNILCTEV